MTTTKPSKKEVNRAWNTLIAEFGSVESQNHGFESWQWMGIYNGNHQFRHRSHPIHGRIVWETPAVCY